ncbi:hypothetical protein Sgly_0758 [Syntrophobotulus glycolicus DSM 8271]|uniref:Uncharacterized protein n=1 Tax=Syntrophobotulus glycolicus (strain DSM 8271 / FlGlyR) TaxID=645991 RepID=F0T0Q0_SYNGF|nr:hypothetical protein [Syntrophobotulus glycolicus]ADY55115.1 hypothetical protein Sgly_0758 [Syntrophobotulus glycolicus DSM 8271]
MQTAIAEETQYDPNRIGVGTLREAYRLNGIYALVEDGKIKGFYYEKMEDDTNAEAN